jgi:hypothetical protein
MMILHDADILERHALRLDDPRVRALVARWRLAALELALFVERERDVRLDLIDASTLAALYLEASDVR